MFTFYGLLEENTVRVSDKKERDRTPNVFYLMVVVFGPRMCCFTKTAFTHASFPVSIERS